MQEPPPGSPASLTPDWSQFATRDDLEKGLSRLSRRLAQWLVGLVTMILNVTAIARALHDFLF